MPNFLHDLATYNNKHGITATHSEMKKTARRLERAFNDRADQSIEAAEFLALAYFRKFSDRTGEEAVAHVMNPESCTHHTSVQRRIHDRSAGPVVLDPAVREVVDVVGVAA